MEQQQKELKPKKNLLKSIRNFFFWLIGIIFFLFIMLFLIFKIPAVQDWAAQKATAYLSSKLNTKVQVGDVTINLFSHLVLNELYIEDLHQDTLLYANHFEVNLGTINPFRKSIKIKNIWLEDAFINLQRNSMDSSYNYAFIAEAFASESSDTSSSEPMNLSLQKLVIEDTRFVLHDEVALQDFQVSIGKTQININELGLKDHILGIESFLLENSSIAYTDLLDTIPEIDTSTTENYELVHINLADWILELNQLDINNTSFAYLNQNSQNQTKGMNFSDLLVSDINIDLSEILYKGDTIQAAINTISLKEKSGFELTKLQSNVLFSSNEISLQNLILETPNSLIKDKIKISYSTLNDFNRFFSSIYFDASLKESKINTDDIAYFSSSLSDYHTNLNITSDVKGSLDKLKLKNLSADAGNIASLEGEISMQGLPDVNETFITLNMNPLSANMQELNKMLGGKMIPSNILELGNVNYQGKFTGYLTDFVLEGNLISSAGSTYTDINYKSDYTLNSKSITGNLKTQNLNIGKLIGNEQLLGEISATVALDATINGKVIKSTVESQIESMHLNGYTYQNIKVDGAVNDKYFDGKLTVNDPNLKQEFVGKIDLNSEVPTFDFHSNIEFANLGKLNLYDKDLMVSAETNIRMTGNSVSTLNGTAEIKNIYISDGTTNYKLSSFAIQALEEEENKKLSIQSDLLDADFHGQYDLETLPKAIADMVKIYVNGSISKEELLNAQNVDFNVKVKDSKLLTKIFLPEIEEIKSLNISGQLNTLNKEFYSRTTFENFVYSGIVFSNTAIEISTNENKLDFFVRLKSIQPSESLLIPITVLEGDFSRDSLNMNLKIGKDTDPERLNLFAAAFISQEAIHVNVLPSEIYLNNEKWNIQPNNSLTYDYKNLFAENFTLQHDEKLISLTSTQDTSYGAILKLQLKNILIQDITEILKSETDIKGSITANINVGNILSKPNFVAVAGIKEFEINGQKVGDLDFTGSLLYPNPKINFNVFVKGQSSMRAYGSYNISTDSIAVEAQIGKIPLVIAEPFMTGLFSQMTGDISGNLHIGGTSKKPDPSGSIEIKRGGLTFDYLNSHYSFAYQKIDITNKIIDFHPSILTDKYQHKIELSGSISHKYFNDITFNEFTISADTMLMMETTYKQNPDFYGKASGKAKVIIDGPLDNMNILINAKPFNDEYVQTVVYLPTYGSGNISKHDFIKFVNRKDTIAEITLKNNLSLVNIDIRLDITPDAKIVLLLSSDGSDTLVAKGTGNLQILANTADKFEMNGIIAVSDGSYNFSFEKLISKNFRLLPGGTIQFLKDPYKAQLDLTAAFTANGVKKSSLTGNEADQQTVSADVLIYITGILESPEINFGINVQEENASSLSEFSQMLAAVTQDKNELNKQVFGLMLTNQFINQGTISNTGSSSLQSGVNNTISEFFSNQLSSIFSDWLAEIFPNADIDVGWQTIQSGELGLSESQQQQFQLGIQQKLLHDKLTIKIGGTYDYTEASASDNSPSNLAGDFEVEYNISPDGSVRVKAFRKSEYDVIVAKNDTKTGLGLFYTKDFNTLADLFKKKDEEENFLKKNLK